MNIMYTEDWHSEPIGQAVVDAEIAISLDKSLAAANARVAELESDLTLAIENMDGPACAVLAENKEMKDRIAELESELKDAVGRNLALQVEAIKWGSLTPDDYRARIAELERERNALMSECNGGYGCYKTQVEGTPCTVENCPIIAKATTPATAPASREG